MGNRAALTDAQHSIGVYLHWNGGRQSVEAFVRYCALRHFRPPSEDVSYAFARLAQVVGNFFGGALSLGVLSADEVEASLELENGIYVIGDWTIDEHLVEATDYCEEEIDDLSRILHSIDAAQPEREQIGAIIDAARAPAADLVPGDQIWAYTEYRKVAGRPLGGYVPTTVRGLGAGKVNGIKVDGIPYADLFRDGETCRENINNYLFDRGYALINKRQSRPFDTRVSPL